MTRTPKTNLASLINILKHIDIFKAFFYFRLLRNVIAVLTSILLAKTVLTTYQLGIFENFIFLTSAFSTFFAVGMIQPLMTEYKRFEQKQDALFFNLFVTLLAFAVLMIFTVWVIDQTNILNFTKDINFDLLPLVLINTILLSPLILTEYVYYLTNQPLKLLAFSSISYLLQLLVVVLPAFLQMPFETIFYSIIILNALRLAWLVALIRKHSDFKINFALLKHYLKLAFPLILATLVGGYAGYIDKFIITTYFDKATFVIFSYGAIELPLAVHWANNVNEKFVFLLNNKQRQDEVLKNVKLATNKMMLYLFPLSILLMFTSHWLFPIVYNINFTKTASIFNIYLLLLISRVVMPQILVLGKKKNKVIFFIYTIEVAINVFFSLLLVQFWGIYGVAAATVIAFFAGAAMLMFYVKLYLKINPSAYIDFKRLALFGVLLLISFCIVEKELLF